jgi:hypothetical protein
MMVRLNKANQIRRLMLIMSLFAVAHCAGTTTKEQKAFETEKMLVAAGFAYKVAEDDAMLAKMARLPQYKLVRHERQGQPIWIYANVDGCKCLYAGDDANYKHLQELIKENKQASHHLFAGSGSDPTARESEAMQVLEIDDGMLPGM